MLDGKRSLRAPRARILVVDDDGPEREAMCAALESAGFLADCVVTAEDGRRYVGRFGVPDLLLLAVRARSHAAELDLCRDIHAGGDVPLIALTSEALYSEASVMEACFDDFIIRPAEPNEIVVRVRRCLRRWQTPSENGDGGSGRRDGHDVEVDGQIVTLTDREAALLRLLLRHPDRPLSRDYLMQQIWPNEAVKDGTLRVTIHRLRRRLEEVLGRREVIVSLRGHGYMFTTDADATAEAERDPEAVLA